MLENIVSLLSIVQHHIEAWFAFLTARPGGATVTADELRKALNGPLPSEGISAEAVAEALAGIGMRATSPAINVVVSEEAHYTIGVGLRLPGLGANRVRRIQTDGQGRMRAGDLSKALHSERGPCIVCAQVGNMSAGAIDPVIEIEEIAKRTQCLTACRRCVRSLGGNIT